MNFEIFRVDLAKALAYSDGSRGGRPPFDPAMMFKALVIQAANSLSDERTEFLISDRLSFMRFLGLSLHDHVPDARTIWLFREKLTKAGAIQLLFGRFGAALRASGGQIVDASLIAAPKQCNAEDETNELKKGRIPEDWKARPVKLRHKDRNARWTVEFSKAKERFDGSKHLNALRWKTSYQAICDAWTKGPPIFKIHPNHLIRGPYRLETAHKPNNTNALSVIHGRLNSRRGIYR